MEKSNFLYLHCGEQYLLQNFRLGLIELATVERDRNFLAPQANGFNRGLCAEAV